MGGKGARRDGLNRSLKRDQKSILFVRLPLPTGRSAGNVQTPRALGRLAVAAG